MYQTQLHDDEFTQFQRWIHQTAGIDLSPAKKALVASRLSKRLCHYELESYGDYFSLIMNNRGPELQIALDLLTTNETYFFREPKHFEFLSEKVLARLPKEQAVRIWSAASSSGEEPYSLAMTLAETLGDRPWRVHASDLSAKVLMGLVLAEFAGDDAVDLGAQVPQGLDVAGITQPHVHARHVGAGHADQALQHGPAHFFQPLVAHPCRGRRLVTAQQVVKVVAESRLVPAHGGVRAGFL